MGTKVRINGFVCPVLEECNVEERLAISYVDAWQTGIVTEEVSSMTTSKPCLPSIPVEALDDCLCIEDLCSSVADPHRVSRRRPRLHTASLRRVSSWAGKMLLIFWSY